MKIAKIYLDMDGVAADFDKLFFMMTGMSPSDYEAKYGEMRFWEAVYENPNFFSSLPAFPYTGDLVRLCQSIAPTVVLSSPSKVNQPLCMMQKRLWINNEPSMGVDFPAIFESHKEKYAAPDRILIDDTPKKIEAWTKAGGIGHLFQSWHDCAHFLRPFQRSYHESEIA